MVATLKELYLAAREGFLPTETPQEAAFLARNLLSHVTGLRQEELLARQEEVVSSSVCHALEDEMGRILEGEPLAYVLGEWEFYGLKLYVNRDVLIPRDDTCAVTGLAIKKALFLDKSPRILDLCTGSGCIGLAIASRVKDARVTLADLSREALAVAKKNITLHHLSGRVSCVQADAAQAAPGFLGKFDMIVSNPPYISTAEMGELPKSVRCYEPELALHGGADGLDFYRAIAENFTSALKPGGILCLEFGLGQEKGVEEILRNNGYTVLEWTRDNQEILRAVCAQYQGKEGT